VIGAGAAGMVLGALLTLLGVWWPYRHWQLHRTTVARFRRRWWMQLPEARHAEALDHARRLARD
jgi:hypothetical protein